MLGKWLLLGALVNCACGSIPTRPPSHEELAYELADKTVALVEDDPEGAQDGRAFHVFCSGVWVGEKYILTAAHCVEDKAVGDPVDYIILGDVTELPGEEIMDPRFSVLAKRDTIHDLALLRAGLFVPAHTVAQVSRRAVNAGDTVVTMTAPLGMVWSFSSGEVAAIRYDSFDSDDPGMWYIQATAPISPGSSGGGLFDEWGDLVGVVRAYVRGGESLNLFVHRDHVLNFLVGVP